jgi:hypothetical protein
MPTQKKVIISTYGLISLSFEYNLLTLLHPLFHVHFQHLLFLTNLVSLALRASISLTNDLTCINDA